MDQRHRLQSDFIGHGYCAGQQDRWIRTLPESVWQQRNVNGTFHPSGPGQQAYADRIYAALTHD